MARAKTALAWYLETPNYRKNLEWLGFTEDEIDAVAPRLLDGLVAIGDEAAIRARVEEHLAAGADQVALQPLGGDDDPFGVAMLGALALALAGV